MKKWAFILTMAVFAVILAFFLQKAGCKTMTTEKLQSSIEVIDVETKWVKKEYHPWPPILKLVPAVSFKVKNLTDKPLRYVNFNAVFRIKDTYENIGDNYLAAIRNDPVLPGELSDEILLKSNFGVEGKSLASFKNNPEWKAFTVTLFAQSQGSQFVELGNWDVSRTIDFKEPEPVNPEIKTDKKPETKK
jgi:hypothetical protein